MIVILGLLFLGAAAALPNYEGRIVGGNDAVDGEYPYIVVLRNNGSFICAGSILNEIYILSAAHCVRKSENTPSVFEIVYGTIDLHSTKNVIPVRRIIKNPGTVMEDAVILELEEDIILGDNAKPVQLPEASDSPGDDVDAVVVGWGYNATGGSTKDNLQKVDITLFNQDYCKSHLGVLYDPVHNVCAGVIGGGKGECNGDSGGPLIVAGKQFGIVFWSFKPCANKDFPGVYTKVTSCRDWIREMTGV